MDSLWKASQGFVERFGAENKADDEAKIYRGDLVAWIKTDQSREANNKGIEGFVPCLSLFR